MTSNLISRLLFLSLLPGVACASTSSSEHINPDRDAKADVFCTGFCDDLLPYSEVDEGQMVFAHAKVPLALVRALVPQELEIETFEGNAYVTVEFLGLTQPTLVVGESTVEFPFRTLQANIRTYVRSSEASGVYFIKTYMEKDPFFWSASRLLGLNLERSDVAITEDEIGWIQSATSFDSEDHLFLSFDHNDGRLGPTSPGFRDLDTELERFWFERSSSLVAKHGLVARFPQSRASWQVQQLTDFEFNQNVLKVPDGTEWMVYRAAPMRVRPDRFPTL